MDQIVAQALTVYGKIVGMKRKEAAVAEPAVLPATPASTMVYGKSNGNGLKVIPNGKSNGGFQNVNTTQ